MGKPTLMQAFWGQLWLWFPWKFGLQEGKLQYSYALFLDSGSSSTFCTEALMRQLGTNGTKTTISLTTLEKKDSLEDSFVITCLTISDLDENVFLDLPTIFTRPSIPVSSKDKPTQEWRRQMAKPWWSVQSRCGCWSTFSMWCSWGPWSLGDKT